MSGARLLAELRGLGITIKAHSGRLRCSPRSAVTPEVVILLSDHRDDVLEALRIEQEAAAEVLAEREAIQAVEREADETHSAQAAWMAMLDALQGDQAFPPIILGALRTADVSWGDDRPTS